MTDNDIIKALKCCGNQMFSCSDRQCKAKTIGNAIDLINRQKAEIERLTIDMNAARLGMIAEHERLKTAKAEAIKEFAERLRKEAGYFGRAVAVEDIDNLVKRNDGGVT